MYALELTPSEKPPRCLTSISSLGIAFNISGYRLFATLEEIEVFKQQWKRHFFNLDKLAIIEVVARST